jgi:hypothetical protein
VTLPAGVVHEPGWKLTKSLQVPLLATGEELWGFFRVPRSAAKVDPHTNQRLTYDNMVRQNVKKWIEWRRAQGWTMRGKPTVYIPTEAPTANMQAEQEEDMVVKVSSWFYRRTPHFMGLDDFLAVKDDADRYGIALTPRHSSDVTASKEHLVADENRNPLVEAERRRVSLGLTKRVHFDSEGIPISTTVEPQADGSGPRKDVDNG